MTKVIVVEDDVQLNRVVTNYLGMNGYQVIGCLNANEAYDAMYNENFDVILSDIMMPNIDGFEFARTVRSINPNIPILFLSARDDLSAKQKGYQAGIDDYMVKPVELEELVLRIEALLRRANILSSKKVVVGNVALDADSLSVFVTGNQIALTVREFNILFKLLSNPEHAFSRAQLMDEFWSLESTTSLRAVDVYITKLRDKFSDVNDFKIVTIHGLGYKAVIS
ncbi:response regulator transcription factor [Enterococcus olivae]